MQYRLVDAGVAVVGVLLDQRVEILASSRPLEQFQRHLLRLPLGAVELLVGDRFLETDQDMLHDDDVQCIIQEVLKVVVVKRIR